MSGSSAPTLRYRDRFDLGDRLYLDGANHGPLPRASRRAAERALGWKSDPATLDDREYFALPDRIRRVASALLGCAPASVAVGTGASHGIGLVACGLDWQAGDRVVIPRGEFPANHLPWLALRERGVRVDIVDPEHLLEAITPGTRAVAVGHVNFATGRRLDLASLGEACERHEAIFVVDAAQSLGIVPFDVDECRATVVAGAGYKWLMSPYGTGITYVRPGHEGRFRLPFFNWASIEGASDFGSLVGLAPRFRSGAVRFDVPEAAAFVQGMAMAESLELLASVGVANVLRHSISLADAILADLPAGYRGDSPMEPAERSGIVRLVGPAPGAAADVHARLRQMGVAVSLREGGLRVAPGLWNEPEDAGHFLESLARATRDAGRPGPALPDSGRH